MHSFDPNIAQQVGVNAAVIYQNIRWWCEKNAANERNIIDGRVWSYNSVRAFTTMFPYLTEKQVRSALDKLEEEGLIIVANHNNDARDRTKWYAITDDDLLPEMADGFAPEGKPVCPVGQMPFAPEGKPLPVSKPVINTVGKHNPPLPPRDAGGACGGDAPQGDLLGDVEVMTPEPKPKKAKKIIGGLREGCWTLDDEFERVWAHHPRKVGKGAARRAWTRARSKASYEQITDALAFWIKIQRGSPIDKIPHFSTWLNQERWFDDQTHARNRAETTTDRLRRLGAVSTEAEGETLAGPTRKPPQIELRIDT